MAMFRASLAALALLALAPACERLAPPPAHEQEAAASAKSESAADPAKAEAPAGGEAEAKPATDGPPEEILAAKTRYPEPKRLVAFGDVHGDLDATKAALRLAGAIDDEGHWAGGDLVLVQTGDQLDRGEDEQAILELFGRLQREAAEAGGAFHILNGNHEFMNAAGDLRYVTPGGFADFEDAPGANPKDPALAQVMQKVPEHARARVAALLPGRPWAKRILAKRNTIVIVGDSVFVHGGVTPQWAPKVDAINREARAWLAGEQREPPKAVIDPNGPVWSRHYSAEPDAEDCALLDEALEILKAERMVVGHTVHAEGVQSACEGKVWMIDVGMAAHYGGTAQVLEIVGDEVEILGGSS